jgi:hypothetical protein
MSDTIWEILVGVFIVTIVFMLVRPGSPAAKAIADVSGALASMIGAATEYKASDSSTT